MEKFQHFLLKENVLEIDISEKFVGERGRINCSLREQDGFGDGSGVQYVVSDR